MAPKRIKARSRTPEEKSGDCEVRELFEDRPPIETLIERGEIDPERIMTGAAEEALVKILIALRQARLDRGLGLGDVAKRSGIDPAALCRLEGGKNPNPTFETLSRYAESLGLKLELSLVEVERPAGAKSRS
jgi:DNA-binding phage protein